MSKVFYTDFTERVARHDWHRTVVKKGLSALLLSLLVDQYGSIKSAKRVLAMCPYDKESYWYECFDLLREKYSYTNGQLHTINSAIIGFIQHENIV